MPSDDSNWWDELRRQLLAAQDVAWAEPLLPKRAHDGMHCGGFSKQEVVHVARFVVDVCCGDTAKTMAYVGRFERAADDRMFARAVHVAVEARLQLTRS